MAFRSRQPGEDLGAYLKAKQDYELATTGRTTVDFGPQGYVPAVAPATAPAVSESTGNAEYDAMLAAIQNQLNELQRRGQAVNPYVEITPEKTAEFMAQAEREISPYYSTQMKLAREGLLSDIGYSTDKIQKFEQQLEQKYGQQVRQLGEQAAETGFLYGGKRRLAEQELAQGTQQDIEARRRQLSFEAGKSARQFAQQWGGQSLPASTIAQAPRVLSGIGTFERQQGVSPLYTLSPDLYQNLIGEQQFAERAAKRRRTSELEQSYRESETAKQIRQLEL